jgi:pyruvate/oxaloacetate carboxyltransferase
MIKITEQALRDGNQSLVASRIILEDILAIAPKLDQVGFFSLEVWSGSLFECCMRFLNEDPWERLKKIKDRIPNTPLQTLLRAQNLLGFRIFSDETVYKFVKYAVKNGCQIFNIFDSLNDTRNMEVPIKAVKKEGGIAEASITYAENHVYNIDKWVQIARELEGFGSDYFSVHDSAGILNPQGAYELVAALKKALKIPIILHCHCSSGMAMLSYWEGCRAGADILETSISPLAGGASLPATEAMIAALRGSPYETELDLKLLNEIKGYFSKLWDKYSSQYNRTLFEMDLGSFLHQLPSGMLSHLIFQLNQMKVGERYQEILGEVPVVIRDLGYPPLATPSSQIIASQAAMNVITGERYKYVSTETKNYVRGMYGRPPGEISEEIKEKVLGKNWREQVIQCRPAALLHNEYPQAEEEAKKLGIVSKPEDILTYLFYPQLAKEFLTATRR